MIQLDENERVLLVVRKHWFVLFAQAFFLVFMVLLPILIFVILSLFDVTAAFQINGNISALYFFFASLWLLFVWLSFFVIWTDFYLDMLIITSEQVIDIEQKGLFSRELSTFRLDRIQDVTSEANGLIQTFFNFGTVHIQTAGEDRNFIIHGVPKPFEVKHFITKEHDKAIERLRTVNISPESLAQLRDDIPRP